MFCTRTRSFNEQGQTLLYKTRYQRKLTFDEKSTQAILTGGGTREPTLSYLPEDYQFVEDITVFASGKDGIFTAGTPIGKTTDYGAVELFVDPNQLSYVTVNLIKPSKEIF